MTVATEKQVCLITIVDPGRSDRVIKVSPSNGTSEKIWLNFTQGKERWEAVKRFLYNNARKGQHVAEPKPWHSDTKNTATPTLSEADIPHVELEEGSVFEVFVEPVVERPKQAGHTDPDAMARLAKLEASVAAIADAVTLLAEKRGPGRPKKDA